MHSGPTLLLVLFCAIALIIFLIVKVRVHAFLALTAASFVVGIGSLAWAGFWARCWRSPAVRSASLRRC